MPDTKVPDGLRYTEQHEWVRIEGDTATFGITDFAQHALGEITYVELPKVGSRLDQAAELAVVESLKAASDVYAPLSGTVVAVNNALETDPKTINADPYGEGWLCKVKAIDHAELEDLLTPKEYAQIVNPG